ncbi:MAG: branched-chain amino acid ABC transporter permease [Burkholderiaceae bacterium]
MNNTLRSFLYFSIMAGLLVAVGMGQSWSVALSIINLCLISAIMALGVNMQWGYAGLFNVGVMGFAALGGLAAVLVSKAPVPQAWAAGGFNIALAAIAFVATVMLLNLAYRKLAKGTLRAIVMLILVIGGLTVYRSFFDPAVEAIESVDAARTGFLGGLGLPIILAWPVGGLFAAAAAWVVGKVALGLRSDYLAIATLGIAEIVIAVLKNEDWLTRGVKNVTGLPRPVPYEVELAEKSWLIDIATNSGIDPNTAASLAVKLGYTGLFLAVLLIVLVLAERALNSPWGRMMRAIRDNETAAEAMGKDVTKRHLQIFILGSAVVGIAGAMLTTLDGQFTPTTYQPLRFTFLVWVMVIVGGSGNNWGSVLGGFLVWFVWIQAEPAGLWLINGLTSTMDADSGIRGHLLEGAPHMRMIFMGAILLLVMRFSPRGLIPERTARPT